MDKMVVIMLGVRLTVPSAGNKAFGEQIYIGKQDSIAGPRSSAWIERQASMLLKRRNLKVAGSNPVGGMSYFSI